ncbi:MAG: hypothetical protein EBY16_06685 [Gammaproteobacteria bacterium]|nr:hypothetical protein [Gammaproteobacteria bacterium]
MDYQIKDTYVYGKILAQNGKPVIVNYDEAEKLTQRFNGTVWKLPTGRYMIKLPETIKSLDECDCQAQPTGELMPQTYNQYPDHEVQMARQELYRTAKLAIMLHDMLKNVEENQGLEGWVQRKLTRAADYIESVFDYLDYEMRYPSEMNEADAMQVTPQTPNQPKTGKPTKPPGMTQTPGMVKMAKVDTNGNVQGIPVMVPQAQVKAKQQAGFHVIGESASAGASSAGGIAGAVGGMGMLSRSGVGSLFGGTYKQKKRRKNESKKTGPKFTGYWKGTDKETPGNKMVGGD